MAILAVLAFIVAEIAAISVVATYLGALPTIGLLLASALIGGWLLRREGTRTLRAATEAFQLRRAADRDITEGLFRTSAGLLIGIPGFLTTLLGIACLLPPTRAVLRTGLTRRSRRYVTATHHEPGRPTAPPGKFTGDVIDGEVQHDN